jgi:hypothetical protein
MVAVTGLMTTDTLFFQAARTYLLLKQNHYSTGTFREKSFVGNYVYNYVSNYVSNSLHLTLAMIVIFLL